MKLPNNRPPDHVVRDHWRDLPVSAWTSAELRLANDELDAEARARGFADRLAYVKSRGGTGIQTIDGKIA